MAFNPISIDDDLGPRSAADRGAVVGAVAGSLPFDGDDVDSGLLSPTTPIAAALQQTRHQYFYDLSWTVPFPATPDAPLLYYPAEYRELLRDPAAVGVTQPDLDAMSVGVMESIPLAFYPLRPGVVAEARAASLATEDRVAAIRHSAQASGQLERLTWRPEEANPQLDKADAELLDTDLDGDDALRRDLPSLTLLQRPLYTDMGLVEQADRHRARLARIVPKELRQVHAAGLPGSPLSPASPLAGAGILNAAPSVFESQGEAAAKRETWTREVARSFRCVRGIDDAFSRFAAALTHAKLGLNEADPAQVDLALRLWTRLLAGTTSEQQRDGWHALCHFSSNYDPAAAEGQRRALLAAFARLRLPQFEGQWRPLLWQYVDAVADHVATVAGGAAGRKEQLNFGDVELDPQPTGGFRPELAVPPCLRRRGTEQGEDHARLPIFPVEVIPVFPSGFHRAAAEGVTAAKSADGDLDYLAEGAEALHHVVLPGATVAAAAAHGPHILIGDTNLIVADAQATVGDVKDGGSIGFRTNHQNTFEPLFHDTDNTASYVLQTHAATTPATAGVPRSTAGRFITYDRVGCRDVYVKAPNVRAPKVERYVVLFDGEEQRERRRMQQQQQQQQQVGSSAVGEGSAGETDEATAVAAGAAAAATGAAGAEQGEEASRRRPREEPTADDRAHVRVKVEQP